uniref:NTF2-related export protein n=1 Tax=Sinocyclocheilus grahami TaxID=75366 RepID=A0A672S1I9_SINGR
MAEKPMWEQIGSGFVQHYYQQFDTDRVPNPYYFVLIDPYCTDASCLTWEGEGFQGKSAIMTKLSSLPFQSIQHIITAQDHHPTPDSCVMSMVMGQLKADQDQVMGFQQVFLLKNVDNKWVCTNDMFRLALHNFGA